MEGKILPVFSRKQKIWTTVGIYFGNICLAIGMNAYSPAVDDFKNKYGVKVEDVTVVFTILTVTYMIGALLTSFIYNFFNRQLGVTLGLTGISTALYLTPHCPSLTTLYAVAGLLGLCNGLYNSSQVVWVIEMWQPAAGPFIQGQHFFYAVGSLVPPILLAPFLAEKIHDTFVSTTIAPVKNERMWIPFTIVAILATVAAIIQLYLFIFQRYSPPSAQDQNEIHKSDNDDTEFEVKGQEGMNPKVLKIVLIILSAVFLGFYQGMEMVTMQLISTFAQYGELKFSPTEGARVMTALTGSFAIARGIGIFANLKIKPQFILAVNILVLFVSSTILLTIGNSAVGLWAGVALLGIGFSTIYPSFCAYIEKHLEFTNAIGSTMLVSGSIVASIFPIVIGQQIEENPSIFIYVNLFSTSLITVAIIIILKLTYNRPHNKL